MAYVINTLDLKYIQEAIGIESYVKVHKSGYLVRMVNDFIHTEGVWTEQAFSSDSS